MLPALALLLPLALLAVPSEALAEPSWYQRKKKIEAEEKAVEEYKSSEKPVIGTDPANASPNAPISNPFSELSAKREEPVETFLLFKRKGLTESFSLVYGKLNQPELAGLALTGHYGMGWWAHPKLIVGFGGKVTAIFTDLYFFVLPSIGIHMRVLPFQSWVVSWYLGWGISQGLTRVEQAHVPPPPGPQALGTRRGPIWAVQLAYFFWPKRELGIGPAITYWGGKQDERSLDSIAIGVTYQSGRPNYTGDVTKGN